MKSLYAPDRNALKVLNEFHIDLAITRFISWDNEMIRLKHSFEDVIEKNKKSNLIADQAALEKLFEDYLTECHNVFFGIKTKKKK